MELDDNDEEDAEEVDAKADDFFKNVQPACQVATAPVHHALEGNDQPGQIVCPVALHCIAFALHVFNSLFNI